MRIVDRETFLRLPPGTLYAKFGDPNDPAGKTVTLGFGELEIKEDYAGDSDWWGLSLIPWPKDCDSSEAWIDRMLAVADGGAEYGELDYETGSMRDGLFDRGQRFAVFDRADAEALIARLQQALADGYGNPPK